MSLRILLADESITIKKVMQLALQEYDVEVRSVPVGSDVVQIAKNFQPEIIFADVLLAKKNGYDVCADMKSEPGLSQIPFVLMWSGFLDFDEARAQQVHPEDRLEKPFDAETLRQLVKKLVPRLSGNPLQDHLIFPEMPEILEDQKVDLAATAEKLKSEKSKVDSEKPAARIPEEAPVNLEDQSMTSTGLTPMSGTASVTATAVMTNTQNFPSALFEPQAPIQLDPLDDLEKEITAQKKSTSVKLPEIPDMEDEPEEFQQVSLSMTKSKTEALWNEEHPANYQYQDHDDDEALTRNMVFSDEVSLDNLSVATMGEDSESDLEEISMEAAEALTGSRSAGATLSSKSAMKEPQDLSSILDQEQIQAMVQEEVQRRVQEVLEDIAWKVIPEIAEKIIQREIQKILAEAENDL
jgi:two-component system cell cycle response regulator